MLPKTQSGGAVKPRRFLRNLTAKCESYRLFMTATAGMSTTAVGMPTATTGMSSTTAARMSTAAV